jgi:peptidoglycan/xylan/chitin deacetylase (PgdA/CDA1 family)
MKKLLLLLGLSIYLYANAHIFVYHRFGDDRHKSTNTSIEELKKEFEYFKKNGYKVVKLSQIVDKLNRNEDIPDNWVSLTIDDSYKSFYENGLEVFKEYGYPFTLFVYVKATDKKYRDFSSWSDLKEVAKYGELGLHSYSHPHLTHLSAEEIDSDTAKALEVFEKNMGFTPKYYAYPYGEYNNLVENRIKKFGFDAILHQSSGSINKKTSKYEIPRVALVGEVNLKSKLRYKSLDVQWILPNEFPKDGILKKVIAKVDPKIKRLKLYVSGGAWKDIKVKNGLVNEELNTTLKRARTRVAISTDYFTISTKMLIKEPKSNTKRKNYVK